MLLDDALDNDLKPPQICKEQRESTTLLRNACYETITMGAAKHLQLYYTGKTCCENLTMHRRQGTRPLRDT